MSIVLHVHPISPPARAALATAKTLKVNVTEKAVELGKDNRTPEYLKLNPAHTVPVMVDGDFSLFESRAIMAYLADTYGKSSGLYPTDVKARAKVDVVLYYDASSLFPSVREYFVTKYLQSKEPTAETMANLKDRFEVLAQLLGDKSYFVGDKPTLADISVAVSAVSFLEFDFMPASIKAWYDRVKVAVPAVNEVNLKASGAVQQILAARKN